MTPSGNNDEERLASLLRELREPPSSWIEAAKELPRARAEIAGIVARAEADAAYRETVLADLEAALREGGVEPTRNAVALLRADVEGAREG